jgi:hypothetical protein
LFERVHSLGVLLDAAEDAAPDLGLAAELVEGREFQHLGIFNVLYAVVGKFVEQGFEHGAGLLAVRAEHIALLDVVGALAPGQRLLVEGDMGDQIKDIQFSAIGHGLLQNVQRHAVFGQFFQHRLLARGGCSSGAGNRQGCRTLLAGPSGCRP